MLLAIEHVRSVVNRFVRSLAETRVSVQQGITCDWHARGRLFSVGCLVIVGCSQPGLDAPDGQDTSQPSTLDAVEDLPGAELSFRVSTDESTFVNLSVPEIVEASTAVASVQWDLAFRGWDVFTNSGPSGPGQGAAFGPSDELAFLSSDMPEAPFLREDTTGGAFLDWYDYDGSTHQLWSRYHVYGVRDAEQLWKVQILGYYGEDFGAPVSALYRLRYAKVTEGGSGATKEVTKLDATAGYPEVSDDIESGCLDLKTGTQLFYTPDDALASADWDLCFRRDAIRVNGERGGPGTVEAVDLDASRTITETLDEVKGLTPESERERFERIDFEDLTKPSLHYRGDRVVSIFGSFWFNGPADERASAANASWLVRDADGERMYLVVFRNMEGNPDAAGDVTLRVREVGRE